LANLASDPIASDPIAKAFALSTYLNSISTDRRVIGGKSTADSDLLSKRYHGGRPMRQVRALWHMAALLSERFY
tara:strand:- start:24939 stop:25160 length:222 start_codon:yes stop_codon:yes gene_type:complete